MKAPIILPSLLLGAALLLALHATSSASAKSASAMSNMSAASPAMLAEGKSLTGKNGCTSCHGEDLKGKTGFSPSLHANGVLKEYNKKTFERVMMTGITNDGTPVKKPMPVYAKLSKSQDDALYAYLKSLH